MKRVSRTSNAWALLLVASAVLSIIPPACCAWSITRRHGVRRRVSLLRQASKPPPPCKPRGPQTVNVGGTAEGWVIPFSWTTKPLVYVGDTLRFSWPSTKTHSVYKFWGLPAYKSCNLRRSTQVTGTRPVSYALNKSGVAYFGCGVGGHCGGGQRFAITVLAAPTCPQPAPPSVKKSPPPAKKSPPPAKKSPPPAKKPPPPAAAGQVITVGTAATRFWGFGLTPAPGVTAPWKPPTVRKGDVLRFKWSGGSPHNLWNVEKTDFDACSFSSTSTLLLSKTPTGDYNYTVTQSATTLYFSCSVADFHCLAGMKIAIPVK